MSEYPQRHIRFTLDLQADTWDVVIVHLEEIARRIGMGEMRTPPGGLSGGWDCGYTYEVSVDPDMDGDTYRAWLEEWSATRRAQREKGDT